MKHRNADIIIAVLAASAIASVFINIGKALALHPNAPAGFLYEAFTCHLVHWTLEHLFYDAMCFAVLAANIRRRHLLAAMLFCAPLISLSVARSHPELTMYGGLSGLNCALYPIAVFELLAGRTRIVALAAVIVALLKTAAEAHLGRTFFATSGFAPIHEAHVIGLAAGCIVLSFKSCIASFYSDVRQKPLERQSSILKRNYT